MLYRLDYLNDDGSTAEAVRGVLTCGDLLCRHMTTARSAAIGLAQDHSRAILVSRIGKAGQVRPSLVVKPDGSCTRPGGMKGEDCVRDNGRTCYCRNCRASRRSR